MGTGCPDLHKLDSCLVNFKIRPSSLLLSVIRPGGLGRENVWYSPGVYQSHTRGTQAITTAITVMISLS